MAPLKSCVLPFGDKRGDLLRRQCSILERFLAYRTRRVDTTEQVWETEKAKGESAIQGTEGVCESRWSERARGARRSHIERPVNELVQRDAVTVDWVSQENPENQENWGYGLRDHWGGLPKREPGGSAILCYLFCWWKPPEWETWCKDFTFCFSIKVAQQALSHSLDWHDSLKETQYQQDNDSPHHRKKQSDKGMGSVRFSFHCPITGWGRFIMSGLEILGWMVLTIRLRNIAAKAGFVMLSFNDMNNFYLVIYLRRSPLRCNLFYSAHHGPFATLTIY